MSPKQQNMAMAVLAYIGPLVIVSYLVAKDDSFVKFHIKQGLVLFAIEVILSIVASTMWSFWMIINLINFAIFVLSVIGIINAIQGKEEELPVVGSFAKYFKI
jgi:uncharacterized membrane protein